MAIKNVKIISPLGNEVYPKTDASIVVNTPTGNISSTTVQAAINELDTEKLGSTTPIFSTIAVLGQSNVVANSSSSTLTLVAGDNVTITTDAVNDSVTISATGTTTSQPSIARHFMFMGG